MIPVIFRLSSCTSITGFPTKLGDISNILTMFFPTPIRIRAFYSPEPKFCIYNTIKKANVKLFFAKIKQNISRKIFIFLFSFKNECNKLNIIAKKRN